MMDDFDIEVLGYPGPQGPVGPTGPAGTVTDGDKGDVVVSGGGAAWAIDSALLTAFMRTVTAAADATAARGALGVVIGTDVQAHDADLDAIAALATAAFGRSVLTQVDAAALRTLVGLIIGTDVQAHDADLDAIAALATTAFGRGLLILSNAAALRTAAALGTTATLDVDVDTALTANSDAKIASQKAVKAYVDASVVGLLDFKGNQDCSANPNYPAASKGDAYYASVAGKIGGASGKSVDIGDVIIAKADNAGGTEASVGTSWFVLEHNLTGALLAANNLSDVASAATARANLGLVIGTDVQAHDADLDAIAALATTSFGRSVLTQADAAALRTLAGLVIGTDVQAFDSDLAAIAALATTSFGRSVLTQADAAALRTLAALGTVATLASDTDTTLAANSDSRVATQKAVKAYVDGAVTGLLDFKGNQDCSANPNYPAASKGDAYYTSVAGKIGGASGKSVDVGDVFIASADNAGGTEASVGTSWFVLEHNLILPQAAGSDRQLQYNNAGSLGGSTNHALDASGNMAVGYASAVTIPAADKVAFVPQRLLASGGRVLPRWQDESGVFSTLQPHLGRNSVAWMQATGSTTPTISAINMTAVGTATSRVPASTNRLTRTRRLAYLSAATAGAAGGLYSSSLNPYSLGSGTVAGGGGFFAVFRWGCSDAATVAGAHMFIGMKNDIATPNVTANPNTFTNCVGVAQLNGAANLNIVYGGSAAQTAIDLGANFPAAGASTDLYELILYAPPNSNNTVYYRIERINTGDVASGTLTGTAGTALPANTTFIGPRMYRTNNATALAVGLDIAGFTIEGDF